MKKRTPFDEEKQFDPVNEWIVSKNNTNSLQKVASEKRDIYIPDMLKEAMQEIEQSNDPDYAYLYNRALGASEEYGPNNNGDWFGKEALQSRHDTFEKHASLYRHHKTGSDEDVGEILVSDYNDQIDSVDLITKAPIDKVAEDLDKIEDGGVLSTSMGAKVKYDVCSICGNKAHSRMEYCKHLRNNMLKIFPDGRQVYAKNPKPKFTDLSIVVVPADPTSAMLQKIASEERLKSATNKSADIQKQSPLTPNDSVSPSETSDRLSEDAIDQLSSLNSEQALWTADRAMGRPVAPDEFKAIMEKDASYIDPDCIPIVPSKSSKQLKKAAAAERPNYKVASSIEKLEHNPVNQSAHVKQAKFLSSDEVELYHQYRQIRDGFSRNFIR